jgi:hypothetical protein
VGSCSGVCNWGGSDCARSRSREQGKEQRARDKGQGWKQNVLRRHLHSEELRIK